MLSVASSDSFATSLSSCPEFSSLPSSSRDLVSLSLGATAGASSLLSVSPSLDVAAAACDLLSLSVDGVVLLSVLVSLSLLDAEACFCDSLTAVSGGSEIYFKIKIDLKMKLDRKI